MLISTYFNNACWQKFVIEWTSNILDLLLFLVAMTFSCCHGNQEIKNAKYNLQKMVL